ncbi:hypothetical protein LCGC14_2625260 [marine sediment metagenome]|uniref:Uncharacterized protein n=1 Tax=marine sediment metagenome TaxID=412755 RepID=A0A0F9APH3_9ZZZZ
MTVTKVNVPEPKQGDLQVYHIQNVPAAPTNYRVDTVAEAVILVNQLARLDLRNPRVDSNAIGLTEWDGEEWVEWYGKDGLQSFDELCDGAEDEG